MPSQLPLGCTFPCYHTENGFRAMAEGDASIRHGREQRRTVRNEQEAVIERPEWRGLRKIDTGHLRRTQSLKEIRESLSLGTKHRNHQGVRAQCPSLPQGRGYMQRHLLPLCKCVLSRLASWLLSSGPLAVCLKARARQARADRQCGGEQWSVWKPQEQRRC